MSSGRTQGNLMEVSNESLHMSSHEAHGLVASGPRESRTESSLTQSPELLAIHTEFLGSAQNPVKKKI